MALSWFPAVIRMLAVAPSFGLQDRRYRRAAPDNPHRGMIFAKLSTFVEVGRELGGSNNAAFIDLRPAGSRKIVSVGRGNSSGNGTSAAEWSALPLPAQGRWLLSGQQPISSAMCLPLSSWVSLNHNRVGKWRPSQCLLARNALCRRRDRRRRGSWLLRVTQVQLHPS